jgi:hypothetical protein
VVITVSIASGESHACALTIARTGVPFFVTVAAGRALCLRTKREPGDIVAARRHHGRSRAHAATGRSATLRACPGRGVAQRFSVCVGTPSARATARTTQRGELDAQPSSHDALA